MPPTRRVRAPLLRTRDDSGFTVVEALVSFVLIAIVSAAAVTAIVNATKTSKGATDRVAAANLAQQDLQAARSLRFPNYPQARSDTPMTVQGTTYSVSRAVAVKTPGGMVNGTCPATPSFTAQPYMIVTTTVTWPGDLANRVVIAAELAC